MDKKQNEAETKYRLGVVVLDALLRRNLLTQEEYNSARKEAAELFDAPIGKLESEDCLWLLKKSNG